MKYTVVGVNNNTKERCIVRVHAASPIHAEQMAYFMQPALLIGGVFEGHLEVEDTRDSALPPLSWEAYCGG